jgi:hypothetical protein
VLRAVRSTHPIRPLPWRLTFKEIDHVIMTVEADASLTQLAGDFLEGWLLLIIVWGNPDLLEGFDETY